MQIYIYILTLKIYKYIYIYRSYVIISEEPSNGLNLRHRKVVSEPRDCEFRMIGRERREETPES